MTWQFLTRGASSSNVADRLDQLVADASSIEGAAGVDQVVLAQRYLRWCDQVESHLRASFEDIALPRGLHTNRHWQIRAITPETRMAVGMINGELSDQSRTLRALRDQIAHYSSLVRPDTDEALILLDTNVLVHGQPLGNVRWEREVGSAKARILMPLIIVDELDKLKGRNDSARFVLRSLDMLFANASVLNPIDVRPEVSIQVLDEPAAHERLHRADDEIIRQARYYAAIAESPVTVFTRDRGMRIRALAAGVDARMLPPQYERRRAEEVSE